MKDFFINKLNQVCDNIIQSIFSPQTLSVLLIVLFTYCCNENMVNTITNTQARMLLQKKKMNFLEKQIAELWIATQSLNFLFTEFSKDQKKQNSEKINEAYKYWSRLKENWKANFLTNYNYISKLQGEKKERYCFYKKGLFTDFEYQFKCRINKIFEEEFFTKLEICYTKYYSKNKSCKVTLPSTQIVNQFSYKISSFYLQISELK